MQSARRRQSITRDASGAVLEPTATGLRRHRPASSIVGRSGTAEISSATAWSVVCRDLYGADSDSVEALARRADWSEHLLREGYQRGLAACRRHPELPDHECAMSRVRMLVLGAPGIDPDLVSTHALELARRSSASATAPASRIVPGILLAAAGAAAGAVNQPHLAAIFAAGSVIAGLRR